MSALVLISKTAFAASIPIREEPTTEVRLGAQASAALKTLLKSNPARTAGDIADTGSMKPYLDESCIVVVEKKPFENLKLGQIVLFSCKVVDEHRRPSFEAKV